MPTWILRSFPGAFGETGINMGMPGRMISIAGQFRVNASNAADGRDKIYREYIDPIAQLAQTAINLDNGDETFNECIMFPPQLKFFMSGSEMVCNFTIAIKELGVDSWYRGDIDE